jgi:hypothetical protein
MGCGSERTEPKDPGRDASTEVLPSADAPAMRACRVRLDDPLNPCAPTVADQVRREQGNDFGIPGQCTGYNVFGNDTSRCLYGTDGALIAWERLETTPQFCEGQATAVFGNLYSMGQLFSCLTVDIGWTWISSFDPGPTTISIDLSAGSTGSSETIFPWLSFVLGGSETEAKDLTLRYWYTADSGAGSAAQQSASCDSTNGLSCDQVQLSLVPVTPPRPKADTYAELSFPTFSGIISTGFRFSITFRITKADGSPYDQSSDHSYNGAPTADPTPATNVTAYLKDMLIYGAEP